MRGFSVMGAVEYAPADAAVRRHRRHPRSLSPKHCDHHHLPIAIAVATQVVERIVKTIEGEDASLDEPPKDV